MSSRTPGGEEAAAQPPSATLLTLLQDPRRTGERALGKVVDGGGSQGLVLDVDLKVGERVVLSVYLVGASPDVRLVIRVMDLTTLNPIARSPLIDDFAGGVYFRLACDGGVRLRIMGVGTAGEHAASAIFVDRR